MKIEDNRLFFAILPITLFALFFAFSAAGTLFLWILCSFFLFALIDPWMQRLTTKGGNPIFLAVVLVLIAFALLSGMGFLIYTTSSGIIVQIISYKGAIFKFYEHASESFSHFTSLLTGVDSSSQDLPASPSAAPVTTNNISLGVLNGLNSLFSFLTFMALTPLLTFFMVAERDLFGLVGSKFIQVPEKGNTIWKEITDSIAAFFLGNIVLTLVSFPVFVLAFFLLGVKSYLSLGLLSAILNLVPFLGFILSATLPTLDLLMNGGHIGGAVGLILICFLSHFTIANVVTPKILGAKLDLNATVSTIALVGWGELWGPLGLVLAIPLTAMIKILLKHSMVPSFQIVAAMMSEDSQSLQMQGMSFVSDRLGLKKKKK